MKIKDIAQLAGVSISAVSLALNGKPGISEATREKILRITQEHGYTTKSLVKKSELHQSKHKMLRFVACTGSSIVSEKYETLPFFTELIQDISENIRSKGYSLIVSTIHYNNLYKEIGQLETDQQSDGILLLGTNLTAEQIEYISNLYKNLVVIDTCFDNLKNVDFVVMNNILGAYDAGSYLVDKGHTKIGYVESNTRIYNFDMRRRGFELALQAQNISIDKQFLFSLSPIDVSAQEVFKQKIEKNIENLPTAIFCECDYMAISVIKSFSDLGIKVPGDVSVIGFDDILEAEIVNPELTTIHVPKNTIASFAVDELVNKIEQKRKDHIKIMVDTKLVERKSCRAVQPAEDNYE